jgi:hypothetical protein
MTFLAGSGRRVAASRRAMLAAAGATALLAAVAGPGRATANDLTFAGYARDIQTGKLLYVESHFVRNFGAEGETRVVHYKCAGPGREPFVRKELRYGGVREEPEFTLVDGRTGYTEGLKRGPDGPRVYFRPDGRTAFREAKVPRDVVIVSDAGFDEFVRKHWKALEAGESVRFPFLIPSRLDYMTFKVRKEREEQIEGAVASVIRLNLSGFLGWFLPYIEVSYRKADQVLVRFKGLTNVRDANGDNVTALIDFPSAERRRLPPGSVDIEAQRALTLAAACRADAQASG